MLLLVEGNQGRGLLLVEVKTTANNAWYAVIENLRQLKLFMNSSSAQAIFTAPHPDSGDLASPEGIVLAPQSFYSARGAKQRAVAPTRHLISRIAEAAHVRIRLGIWDPAHRSITDL